MSYLPQFLAFIALFSAAVAVAPMIHWLSRRSRSVTSLAGSVSGFVLLVALALALGPQPFFRAALLWSVAGGGLASLALLGRRSRVAELSIRPY
jgi:hypothetical protein